MDVSLPCGTASRTYKEDMAIVRTVNRYILLVGFILLLIISPIFLKSHLISLFTIIGIWIIAAHGLNILVGYCGQISLGHSAFMGIGAYSSAVLGSELGFSFWVSMPCGIFISGLIGILFGLPSLRIKGFYLAMATLAAQFIMAFLFLHWEGVTGGYAGMPAPSPELGSLIFDSERSYYYLVMFFAALTTFLAKNLARTRTGRAF
ncbi:MAG: branched-chain amino acid ABC transporter permease, partial [Thermodesulfobacteriota bacterium]|nr:branched-chain amino acid ABC transporter permease [Thermodesulfobacteriota bacterium]